MVLTGTRGLCKAELGVRFPPPPLRLTLQRRPHVVAPGSPTTRRLHDRPSTSSASACRWIGATSRDEIGNRTRTRVRPATLTANSCSCTGIAAPPSAHGGFGDLRRGRTETCAREGITPRPLPQRASSVAVASTTRRRATRRPPGHPRTRPCTRVRRTPPRCRSPRGSCAPPAPSRPGRSSAPAAGRPGRAGSPARRGSTSGHELDADIDELRRRLDALEGRRRG